MFFDTHIEYLYLIDGLSRSGNHVFIEWLISSFQKNEVYFLNNVYPKSLIYISDQNIIKLMTNSAATSDGFDQSSKMGSQKNIEKLVTQKEMLELLKGNTKNIKVLIMSIENNFVDILDFFQQKFINAKKVFKVIILRDILNLLASRFAAEQKIIKEIMEERPDFKWHKYETDSITFGYWINNYQKSLQKDYIVFNYNKFILDKDYQKELAQKLNIKYDKTEIVKSKFLMGSSFKNDENSDIFKYFMRWKKYENNESIHFLINQKEIQEILCNDFYFCLEDNFLLVKDHKISLIEKQEKKIDKKKLGEKLEKISLKMKMIQTKSK